MWLHIEVIRQVRVAWGSVDISVRRVLIWEGLVVVAGLPSWCSRDKETAIHDPPTWKGISWNFRISTQKLYLKAFHHHWLFIGSKNFYFCVKYEKRVFCKYPYLRIIYSNCYRFESYQGNNPEFSVLSDSPWLKSFRQKPKRVLI